VNVVLAEKHCESLHFCSKVEDPMEVLERKLHPQQKESPTSEEEKAKLFAESSVQEKFDQLFVHCSNKEE
jgi:hypothetical protein